MKRKSPATGVATLSQWLCICICIFVFVLICLKGPQITCHWSCFFCLARSLHALIRSLHRCLVHVDAQWWSSSFFLPLFHFFLFTFFSPNFNFYLFSCTCLRQLAQEPHLSVRRQFSQTLHLANISDQSCQLTFEITSKTNTKHVYRNSKYVTTTFFKCTFFRTQKTK